MCLCIKFQGFLIQPTIYNRPIMFSKYPFSRSNFENTFELNNNTHIVRVREREREMAIDNQLTEKIAGILDEAKASNATHIRKLKDLSNLRSSNSAAFFPSFSKTLAPLFDFSHRTGSAERTVRFVSMFATIKDSVCGGGDGESFLQEFLRFLVAASSAGSRNVRVRACQIISEV